MHYQHRFKHIAWIAEVSQNILSLLRLDTRQFEPVVFVMTNNEVAPGIAQLAHTIEQNDSVFPIQMWC